MHLQKYFALKRFRQCEMEQYSHNILRIVTTSQQGRSLLRFAQILFFDVKHYDDVKDKKSTNANMSSQNPLPNASF